MSKDKQGFGEQAISKAAEIGFSSQLDEAQELDVEIETNPLEALQGKVDSVSVTGKKLVQISLHLEEMKMHIGCINIDAMSAAFADIKLTKPTDATARFILTEQDISRALNSELMHNQLQNFKVQVDGQPMAVDVQQAEFFLPGDGKIGVKAEVFLQETSETHLVAFTAVPNLGRSGTISLKDIQYSEGENLSPELTKILQDKITRLLGMRDFALERMSLHITNLEVQKDSMIIQSESHVERLPSS